MDYPYKFKMNEVISSPYEPLDMLIRGLEYWIVHEK